MHLSTLKTLSESRSKQLVHGSRQSTPPNIENFSQVYNFYYRNFEKKNKEKKETQREKEAEKILKNYLMILIEYISHHNNNGGYNLYLYI